jgi:tetrahydromethanopterin S-methyltransferase subunit A
MDGIAFTNAAVFHLVIFGLETSANATGQSLDELRENFINHLRGVVHAATH